MTAEQLSVKINLDISNITAGVKKVKTQLAGMADAVKQSIPKINTESKKANDSLGKIGNTSKQVQKALKDIGDEAKDSLSGVISQSNKVTNALKDVVNANSSLQTSASGSDMAGSADDANASLQQMQGTMQKILQLDFIGVLLNAGGFSKFKASIEGVKASINSFKDSWRGLASATKQANDAIKKAKDLMKEFAGDDGKTKQLESLKKSLTQIKKLVFKDKIAEVKQLTASFFQLAKSVGLVIVKSGALVASLAAVAGASIANSTAQFREEQVKLNSAFTAAGASAKEASQAYNGLFRFLGESSRSVEAANHLAKITTNTKDLAEWTTICQGIYATFGDSLPIESLTEAANESLRVGKVTGTLADALNWAGVSEDAFNAKLEQTTSLEEREALLRQTLNGLYQNAAQIYEHNNQSMIRQNEAQAMLDKTMARIGRQTQSLVTSFTVLKATVMNVLAPAIVYASSIFSVLIDKISAAIKWLGQLVGISFESDKIGGIVNGATTGIEGAAGATGDLTQGLNNATDAAKKLRKATMGFDELNIVTNPNTESNNGGAAGAGAGDTGISGFDGGANVLGKIDEKIEDIKSKVEDFFEKWKTQIAIIGTMLGALGITKLTEGLGKALGAGDKFLGVMNTIKNIAKSAIVIVLQYSLVNEFLDKYIDGDGFKNYIYSMITAALGSAYLYAKWGAGGLVVGLSVTAIASLKAVIDNGGVDSTESAVTAFTGLSAAIAAVAIAIKKVNWTPIISGFKTIKTAISPVVTAVGTFVSGLSAGAILTVAAIIAAIASAAYFLYENWDKVSNAAKNFFNLNIAPKIESIKESFEKIRESLSGVGEAFLNALPPSVVDTIQNIGAKISGVIDSIKEWAKSVDWIQGIGKVFEVVGGIIFTSLTTTVAGAISMVVGAIDGAIKYVSGVVQIVSGVIEAIVRLCTGDLQGAKDAVQDIVDGIVDVFTGMYDMTIGLVVDWVAGIIDWCVSLWDELVGHSIIPDMCEAIIDWFNTLYDDTIGVIVGWVKNIIKNIKDMWSDIKQWFTSNIAPKFTKSYWTNKFDTIRQAASDKLNAVKSTIRDVWNNIKGWFSTNIAPKFTLTYWTNKFSTIKDGAKAAFNGIISVVENAVNGIIRNINTLHWTIPDWVPIFGGDTFGFNFSTISIPRLATGGIATRSTLANIGEAGAEAILPLENNTQWMDMLADKIAARQGTAPTKVSLIVDGKELGWATIRNINAITNQTGGLQLVL